MPPKLVAVALPSISDYELEILEGLREIAREERWELVPLIGGYEAPLRVLLAGGDIIGTIGDFPGASWMRGVRDTTGAFVQLANSSLLPGETNVGPDFLGAGREAAATFQREGCEVLAYLGPAGPLYSSALCEGFRQSADEFRLPLLVCASASAGLQQDFIDALPPATGLLAASDTTASLAARRILSKGRTIPGDIAVIGVGNSKLPAVLAGMPLSTFRLPGREVGRQAALRLAARIAGSPPGERVAVAALLEERESSIRRSGGLHRALHHLRHHLEEPLTTKDLCTMAGMSKRAFEMAFQREFGCSPARFVASLRSERARSLLADPAQSIQSVGIACGYPEPSVFSTAFRRWTGFSPSAFRAHALRS
jgi:AraC-like DNA-binding protein